MSQPLDIRSLVPKSKTPKKLEHLATDIIALGILGKVLPTLDNWFAERAAAINGLRALKTWYWDEASRWLGNHNSASRQLLNKTFTELLHLFYSNSEYKALIGFVVQCLFGCNAGHLEVVQEQLVSYHHSFLIVKLLRETRPFYITGLFDTSLEFPRALPLIHLMMYSLHLKCIHLEGESCVYALKHLERTCPRVEVIKIDVDLTGDLQILEELYKAFFKNHGEEAVIANFQFKENIPLSFKYLKKFHMRYDRMPLNSLPLFFCSLLHFYPNLTVQLTNLIALPFGNEAKKIPWLCPSLLVEMESFELKRSKSVFWNKDLVEWKSCIGDQGPVYISPFYFCQLFCKNARLVHESLHHADFHEIKFVYHKNQFPCVTLSVNESIGSVLQELYVYGTINNETALKDFIKALNRCPLLRILSLFICTGTFSPSLENLQPLLNLNILSVFFIDSVNSGLPVGVTDERNVLLFLEPLVNAAPNLRLLEMQGRTTLIELVDRGMLNEIDTLSITEWLDLRESDFYLRLEKLLSLKFLILNRNSGSHRYLHLQRRLRNTDLEVIFKKERLVFPLMM